MIEYGGGPADWIAYGGKPARCLGDPTKRNSGEGMPSYEHEDNGFVVYDFMLCHPKFDGGCMLLSRWYGVAAVLSPDDMVPLHHGFDALWQWRPVLYHRSYKGYWQALGSQMELGWRQGLREVQIGMAMTREDLEAAIEATRKMEEADERAEALLTEHLTPFQQVERAATAGDFRVRGGRTGHMYCIQMGNGFARVDEATGTTIVSYCLHPEGWIPHADVSLATKLQLEDPETELELIEGARATAHQLRSSSTWEERRAATLEIDLIPR